MSTKEMVLHDVHAALSGFDGLASADPHRDAPDCPRYTVAVFKNGDKIPLLYITDGTTMWKWRRRVLSWMSCHCSSTNLLRGYYDALVTCVNYKQDWGMEW